MTRRVAPSLIAGDWGRLGDEAEALERAGADWIHLDVMDGHFVPNLTFGPDLVQAVRARTALFLDVHLMISEPGRYIERFAAAGADLLSVHAEVAEDPATLLRTIRGLGKQAGLVLNPPTEIQAAEPYLSEIDLLLIMSVQPGFAGQSFMPEVLPKLRRARTLRSERGARFAIEIDGGIQGETARAAWAAGADVVVAGAAVLRQPDYRAAIAALKAA